LQDYIHGLAVVARTADLAKFSPDSPDIPRRRRVIRFAFVVVATCTLSDVAHGQQRDLSLLDYHTTVPAGWTSRAPSSTSRLAEFVIPETAAGSAEVVVYFFGPRQGGNVDANLARWRSQFSNPDSSPVYERVTRDSSGAFPLTIAEYRGSYRRGIGAGSADSVRAGQELIAAIVETPRGVMFIQMFGPIARVVAERETYMRLLKDLK
jgi:hypothetical protein